MIHGDKRGRELGFPTANLKPDPSCGLRHGIYAVRAAVGGRRYDGVASFGRRPMFDAGTVLLEIFLFDFSGDLYGATMDVAFIGFLRDEAIFASAEELIRQMQEDAGWRAKRSRVRLRRVSADLEIAAGRARGTRAPIAPPRSRAARPAPMRCQPIVRPASHGDAEDSRIEQP